MALNFRDRIVQHAINNLIEPIFDRTFIYDSYACRKTKGTHAGADRLTQFLRKAKRNWSDVYCFKCDIQQYFPSINRAILFTLLQKKISDLDLLRLLANIVFGAPQSGIPIGNLTSQLFANIYLNELDHYIKEELRIKYYLRYMDDFIILHPDKKELRYIWQSIEDFLTVKLMLIINRKSKIYPINQGVDFLGYRIWPTHRLLRKRSIKRMRRYFKKLQNGNEIDKILISYHSWEGHAKHANTYKLRQNIFKKYIE